MIAYSKNPKEQELLQLSGEVSRIAGTLARLSTETIGFAVPPIESASVPDVSVESVRSLIRGRRLRNRYFAEDLFADPAWDILLHLFLSELLQVPVPVSTLCMAAAVPPTTALRWVTSMTEQALVRRQADPHDGRRVFVELTPETSLALRRYFTELGDPEVGLEKPVRERASFNGPRSASA